MFSVFLWLDSYVFLSGGSKDRLFHNQNRYEYDIVGVAVKKCEQPYSTCRS